MSKYTYDRDAEKLSLLGDKDPKEPEAKPVLCPNDQSEMNYHAATDQWQCPQCGATNGGKPQTETPDEPTDPIHDGSS